MNQTEISILATLSFFDTMNLPLAPLEIYRNILPLWKGIRQLAEEGVLQNNIRGINYLDFLNILETSEIIKSKTNKFNGMYSLRSGDEEKAGKMARSRHVNYRTAIKKWILLRRLASFFEAVPFCQAVLASGSITKNNTSEKSDIDLLIICKYGRIWMARAFFMLAAKLSAHHRSGKKVSDMLCLNHFISDKDLEINHKSIYTADQYSKLVPIFSRKDFDGEIFIENFRQKNQWIKSYLPLWQNPAPRTIRKFKSFSIFRFTRSILEFLLNNSIGDFIEQALAGIQKSRIKKDAGKPGGRVIFSDDEIELHPNSPERRIIDGLNCRIKGLGVEEYFKDSGLL